MLRCMYIGLLYNVFCVLLWQESDGVGEGGGDTMGELDDAEEDILLQEYHSEDETQIEKELATYHIHPWTCQTSPNSILFMTLLSRVYRSDTEEEVEEDYVRKVSKA